MRVLVTGGAGFIGSHLCEELIARGHSVTVLDNLEPQVHGPAARSMGAPAFTVPGVKYVIGDVRDRAVLAPLLMDCNAVCHLAAAVGIGQSMYKIEHYVDVNIRGTSVLLDLIVNTRSEHAIQKIVLASSMSNYGEGLYVDPETNLVAPVERSEEDMTAGRWEVYCQDSGLTARPLPVPEEKPLMPTSIYAETKRAQEELFLITGRAYGIPSLCLRLFNTYGPRQALSNPYTGVIAIFASRLLQNEAPRVYEDGLQQRDFVYVKDVARAFADAVDKTPAGKMNQRVFNVGTGKGYTVRHIADELSRLLKRPIAPEITGQFRAGDIRHMIADTGAIRASLEQGGLGWEPQVSFEEGLAETVRWIRAQNLSQSDKENPSEAETELLTHGLLK